MRPGTLSKRLCLGLGLLIVTGAASRGRGAVTVQSIESLLNTPISAASKYEETMSAAPASVTVLTSDDIERYGWRTLEEALQTVRGLYVSNDRNYSYLGARGFGRPTDYNNRVLVLVNGHTKNDDFYSSAGLGPMLGLNLDAIERIEIVRGPGSALYGTGAVFAVIDVITKDADAIDGLRISAEAGSFGRVGASGVYGGEIARGVDLTLAAQWQDVDGQDLYYAGYDDAETNGGVAEGLDWDRVGGAHATLTAGDVSAQAMWSSRKTGIPTGAFETAFNDPTASTLDETLYVELDYAVEPNARTGVTVRGYVDRYHYFGVYPYDGEPTYFEKNDSWWGGVEARLRWDVREYNRLVIGVEAQRHVVVDFDVWDSDDTRYTDGSYPFTVLSAYGQNTYQPLEDLSLTGGFRADIYSSDENSVTPRAAVVYRVSQTTTLKALYGEAFRVPTRYERFYVDPGYHKINPRLGPESGRTLEAVWEQRIGARLLGVLSAYRYDMADIIGEDVDPADEVSYFANVGEVHAAGLEVEVQVQLGSRGRAYASYAHQRAEDPVSGVRLTNSPTRLARAGVTAAAGPLHAAASIVVESGRSTVKDTETDAFALLNLSLSTDDLFGGVRAALHVRNVLDESYAYPGGHEHRQAEIAQNGRDIMLTIESRF